MKKYFIRPLKAKEKCRAEPHPDEAIMGFMGCFEDIQRIVRKIPRGKVATYGSLACAAGHSGMARQVAWALRVPKAERLPWHRVLGHGGRILLPGEAGLHQRTLLELEGVVFKGNRVDMRQCGYVFPKSGDGSQ